MSQNTLDADWACISGILGTHLTEIHQQGDAFSDTPGYIADAAARNAFVEGHAVAVARELEEKIHEVAARYPEKANAMRNILTLVQDQDLRDREVRIQITETMLRYTRSP